MKHVMAAMVAVLATGTMASAQDQDRDAERRVSYLKRELGLTDEQVTKATELYKADTEAQKKREDERRAKIRELLTDEQKTKYDDLIKAQDGGGRAPGGGRTPPGGGAFGGGMTGWLDKFLEPLAENLKKELALADEPAEKIKAIIEDVRKKVNERIEEFKENGFRGLNWQDEMKKFQDQLKEAGDKIKEHLTDEQKTKYDKLVEDMQKGFGGGAARPAPPGRPTAEDRAKRAMETLKIEKPEDAAAVKEKILKVIEAQNALEEFDREGRTKVDALQKDTKLGDDEIAAKLKEQREARLAKDKTLKTCQKELNEIVSTRQELELIKLGLLR